MFKLHTQTEIAGPKVLGVIDLSSINQTTRPKKKSKEERRKEREEKNRQGRGGNNNAAQGQNAGEKKKRTRIGKERVDVNAASNQQGNKGRQNQATSRVVPTTPRVVASALRNATAALRSNSRSRKFLMRMLQSR